ncbi:hypothetical protein FOL47_001917 [Perkinsus chesapeaki]|uniref:SWIM-type domain-containing protein n=1 Tax=Perkinsus chesapeaki TaxID=330153 RepID=A0A7J6KRV3_PERCH|nr:hypothetical protein FOL47_001917 [Perkinsus chesapeaki]
MVSSLFRWTRSKVVRKGLIFLDSEPTTSEPGTVARYFIPSEACARLYGTQLGDVLAQFKCYYDSRDWQTWRDASDFDKSNQMVRVVKVTDDGLYRGYRCSCPDGVKYTFCRHCTGLMILEDNKAPYEELFSGLIVPGRSAQGCLVDLTRLTRKPRQIRRRRGLADTNRHAQLLQQMSQPTRQEPLLPSRARQLPRLVLDMSHSLVEGIDEEDIESSGDEADPLRAIEDSWIREAEDEVEKELQAESVRSENVRTSPNAGNDEQSDPEQMSSSGGAHRVRGDGSSDKSSSEEDTETTEQSSSSSDEEDGISGGELDEEGDIWGSADEDSRRRICRSPAVGVFGQSEALDLSPIEHVDWSASLSHMQAYFGGSPEVELSAPLIQQITPT